MTLPNGWALATIPELTTASDVFADGDWVESKDQDPNGDVRLIQLADVGDGFYVDKSNRFLTSQKAVELGCTFLSEGDILVARMPDPLGRACIFPGDQKPSVTVVDVCIIRARAIDHEWLVRFINAPQVRRQISDLASGTTRTRISRGNLATISIPLPPLAEQRRIVARLDELLARSRKARESLARLPALLDKLRQAVLAAAFRGDLTKEWREAHPDVEPAEKLLERIREERRRRWEEGLRAKGKDPKKATYEEPALVDTGGLPELPAGWAWASLPELAWHAGYGTSQKCDYEATGIPVLRIPNVARGIIDLSDVKRVIGGLEIEGGDALAPGDFVTVRTNGSRDLVGRSAVVVEPFADATFFASYLIRHRLLGDTALWSWLSLVWQSPLVRAHLERLAASSAGQYNVSLEKLASVPLPIPPQTELGEATRIAKGGLGNIDLLERANASRLARLATLDQALLAKAFRGELVPQDPSDEPASVLLERLRAEREASGEKPARGRKPKGAAKAAKASRR